MIIDSHTHIGTIPFVVGKNRVCDLKGDDLILAMQKYKIDFALVSGLEGSEFDSDGKLAGKELQVSQLTELERIISFTRKHKSKVKGLFWAKPYTEGLTENVLEVINQNSDIIAGLKLHPTLSGMKLTDERFSPYLKLAEKRAWPVQIHTENDGFSDVINVGFIASKYPGLKFIMVHMGMNSDNSEAISLIKKHDNIFGDTCVVSHQNVIRAVKECGSEKILFGTDAVVKGIDTYQVYMELIDKIRNSFTEKEADNILWKNCSRLFQLSYPEK